MKKFAVKVTQTPGQTRLTIPKLVAEETGLDKAVGVTIEIMADKSIKIYGWVHDNKTERRI